MTTTYLYRSCLSASVLVLVALTLMGPAYGGTYQVSPTKVKMPAKSASSLLKIHNSGTQSTRFQISVFVWDQSRDDQMILTKTEDLFVYPSLLAIPPGATRSFRVGTKGQANSTEKSYRLMVSELPTMGPAATTTGLAVLTRMSIPVFVTPAKEVANITMHKLSLTKDIAKFDVRNPGSIHFMLKTIHVTGYNKANGKVFEEDLAGWYVLSQASQGFEMKLKANDCASVERIELSAYTSEGEWKQGFTGLSKKCDG